MPMGELLGQRFLTFNSVIRVNQMEATCERNAGADECEHHIPQNVDALRQAVADDWPDARLS